MMKPRAASLHGGPRKPITIYEDDSIPEQKVRKDVGGSQVMRRCVSVPTTLFDVESILRFKTVDESLHSTYGSDDGRRHSDTRLRFKSVVIREYARTVGDNPSCSSGPPVRYVKGNEALGFHRFAGLTDTLIVFFPIPASHGNTILPASLAWRITKRTDRLGVRILKWCCLAKYAMIC